MIQASLIVVGHAMSSLTIEYPPEVLWALQQEPQEFEADARLLLAIKFDEIGRLSLALTGALGILLFAKERGLIPSVADGLTALQAAGLWVDPSLVAEMLRLACCMATEDGINVVKGLEECR